MAGGRPLKLNERTHRIIVDALAKGLYRETAASLAGIGVTTLYRWLANGETDTESGRKSEYRDLYEATQLAEAKAEEQALETIKQASNTHWQAAAWFLERKSQKRWGKAERVELSGKLDHGNTSELDEEIKRLAEELARN